MAAKKKLQIKDLAGKKLSKEQTEKVKAGGKVICTTVRSYLKR